MTLMPKLACLPHKELAYTPFANNAPHRRIALFSRKNSAKAVVLKHLAESISGVMHKP
jgi:hypothetical protein